MVKGQVTDPSLAPRSSREGCPYNKGPNPGQYGAGKVLRRRKCLQAELWGGPTPCRAIGQAVRNEEGPDGWTQQGSGTRSSPRAWSIIEPHGSTQSPAAASAQPQGERRHGHAGLHPHSELQCSQHGTMEPCPCCATPWEGTWASSRAGSGPAPWGTAPSSQHSQPTQLPLLVQLLEEGFAKLVGADHDGTGGCHLNDTGQETCKQPPCARLSTDTPQEQPGG